MLAFQSVLLRVFRIGLDRSIHSIEIRTAIAPTLHTIECGSGCCAIAPLICDVGGSASVCVSRTRTNPKTIVRSNVTTDAITKTRSPSTCARPHRTTHTHTARVSRRVGTQPMLDIVFRARLVVHNRVSRSCAAIMHALYVGECVCCVREIASSVCDCDFFVVSSCPTSFFFCSVFVSFAPPAFVEYISLCIRYNMLRRFCFQLFPRMCEI